MSAIEAPLLQTARELGKELKSRGLRLVLAESCTGGAAAMALTDVPGISEVFCGSAVTYRNATKAGWLGVSQSFLDDPAITAVSHQVAEQMCHGVLENTPEADLAAAVTGHLGPAAPPDQDGMIYIGIAFRSHSSASVQRRMLTDSLKPVPSLRYVRQREAARLLLQAVIDVLRRDSR